MAYTMTFESLQNDVHNYLERGFTSDSDSLVFEQIPRLINMAERRISNELKIQGLIRVVERDIVAGTAVYTKPDRWRDTVSINVAGKPLFSRNYEYLKAYWPNAAIEGTPEFYSDYDFYHWLIAPTPSVTQKMEILFYEIPQLLDETNQTNWITKYASSALLYATLLEAEPFLKNDQRLQLWQAMYDRTASTLNGQDLQKIMDRSARRSEA